MKCTVVVRALNEKENLYQLINLLETQTKINFELVVIDSGSTDGTVEMLSEYEFKFPFYFTEIAKEEFSFGKALNKAIELSSYKDIIVSISAHCFPINDKYLLNMTRHFIKEDIGLVLDRDIRKSSESLFELFSNELLLKRKSDNSKSLGETRFNKHLQINRLDVILKNIINL